MKYVSKKEAIGFLLPIFKSEYKRGEPFVIAIDGRSASGKTTFSQELCDLIGASVIHTDDFFRPRNSKGELEISQYCGNFDIERFENEVVRGISSGSDFCVSVFDCKVGAVVDSITYQSGGIYIVEGAYSLHPDLGKYWDIGLFFDIEPELQRERIVGRNGIELFEAFEKIWIPAEERYFEKYKIMSFSDAVII